MEDSKSDMFLRDADNFNVWKTTYDPEFLEINLKSSVRREWLSYPESTSQKFEDSPIKPLNLYVDKLYQPPKLIGITNNTVHLQQQNHAEYFLLKNGNDYTNVDRPHVRQYYQSKEWSSPPEECSQDLYKFYVPWIIDEDIFVRIEQPAEESPFFIYPSVVNFKNSGKIQGMSMADFVKFHFKYSGSHMANSTYGKIKTLSPMYDMFFEADAIMIEKIRKFYEKD